MVKRECVFSVTHNYAEIPLLSVFTVWAGFECFVLLLQKHQAGAANWNYTNGLFGLHIFSMTHEAANALLRVRGWVRKMVGGAGGIL